MEIFSTDENPVDHSSRGLAVSELLSFNWFTGLKFLWEREIFPFTEVISELSLGDPEVRKVQEFNTRTTEQVALVNHLSNLASCPGLPELLHILSDKSAKKTKLMVSPQCWNERMQKTSSSKICRNRFIKRSLSYYAKQLSYHPIVNCIISVPS